LASSLPRASVIVPTFHRPASLYRCLRSLLEQSCPPEQYEIIVVDNACDADTLAVIEELDCPNRIRYIAEPNPGLLAGRHRGAAEAGADVLVFVDDDIVARRDWLPSLLSVFDDPSVGMAGGRSLPRWEVAPPAWLETFWSDTPYGGRMCAPLSLIDLGEHSRDIDPRYIWGVNLAIRRAALVRAGGFNPDSIPDRFQMWQGDGETGLARKARRAGIRAVYVPGAIVEHVVPRHRLTEEYFERRGFYQGVCDSFADLREGRGRPRVSLRSEAGRLLWLLRSLLPSTEARAAAKAQRRYRNGRRAGYRFHQEHAMQDDRVWSWTQRGNYWDYALPEAPPPACTILMLITPPELPVARYTVPALKHLVAGGRADVVIFANGLSSAEEHILEGLIRGLSGVTIRSNRNRVHAERGSMRIGEWYETPAGRRELRVGYYESAPEVWEREVPWLGTKLVGIMDADFEALSGGFLEHMIAFFDHDPTVAVVSTEWDPTRRVYDSYGAHECVLMSRYHTCFCLYSARALAASADFSYFEEVRDGALHKYDHSARLQEQLLAQGYTGRVLPAAQAWSCIHYGAFAQNRSLHGIVLTIYRFFRIGRHNGWYHSHRTRWLIIPLRVAAAAAYTALGLRRYDRERARYRWE
jgi:glucosyl-dolichyl phosphate glucuronosyltransferase